MASPKGRRQSWPDLKCRQRPLSFLAVLSFCLLHFASLSRAPGSAGCLVSPPLFRRTRIKLQSGPENILRWEEYTEGEPRRICINDRGYGEGYTVVEQRSRRKKKVFALARGKANVLPKIKSDKTHTHTHTQRMLKTNRSLIERQF